LGSVAEFVGKGIEYGGLRAERRGRVFRFDHGLQGMPKASTRLGSFPEPGEMQSLQSMDGPVLGLHSCRALSPEPQRKVAQPPTTKKLVSGLSNRFEQAIERAKPKDQPCSWKLRRF
jgi:hypothetical protein